MTTEQVYRRALGCERALELPGLLVDSPLNLLPVESGKVRHDALAVGAHPEDVVRELANAWSAARSASVHASTGVNMGRQGTLAYWLVQMFSLPQNGDGLRLGPDATGAFGSCGGTSSSDVFDVAGSSTGVFSVLISGEL